MKIYSVEGNGMKLDGGSMYGHVPKTLWEKWSPADSLNRIPLACRTVLVQTQDGRNYLLDAGIGDFFDPRMKERYGIETEGGLQKNLEKKGLQEKDIDGIILTHMHFDHAGGLLSSDGKLLFPKARYYVGKEHWARVKKPHIREKTSFIPQLTGLLEDSGRLVFIDEVTHPELNFGIRFTFSHGHTVGLLIIYLEGPDGLVVFASDLIPGNAWIHLPVTMSYDRYPELIVDEKVQLLELLAHEKGRVFFPHDPITSSVLISRDTNGKYIGVDAMD